MTILPPKVIPLGKHTGQLCVLEGVGLQKSMGKLMEVWEGPGQS